MARDRSLIWRSRTTWSTISNVISSTPAHGTLLPGHKVAMVVSTGKPKVAVPEKPAVALPKKAVAKKVPAKKAPAKTAVKKAATKSATVKKASKKKR